MLSAAGIYGVMAHSVTQRTREIGIRKALGGQNAQVLWDIARRGLVMTAFGLGMGALLALSVGRLLATQIYQVSATDPLFLGGAALVLGLVAMAAALIPASRAARVEPAIALRSE
jgi:ABC-type antimicrobial peptide transport system permease subunit